MCWLNISLPNIKLHKKSKCHYIHIYSWIVSFSVLVGISLAFLLALANTLPLDASESLCKDSIYPLKVITERVSTEKRYHWAPLLNSRYWCQYQLKCEQCPSVLRCRQKLAASQFYLWVDKIILSIWSRIILQQQNIQADFSRTCMSPRFAWTNMITTDPMSLTEHIIQSYVLIELINIEGHADSHHWITYKRKPPYIWH